MLLFASSQPSLTTKSECILIVGNPEQCHDAVVATLNREGYKVITAQTGTAVLSLTCRSSRNNTTAKPALIVLDTALPDIDGLDLCRTLRQEGCYLPILIISGRGSEMDRVLGFDSGADAYLVKPLGMQELLARCQALLRRSSWIQHQAQENEPTEELNQSEERFLSFEDIVLYLDSCRVVVRGQEVSLSPREFHLLKFLIAHPRSNWSRAQLLQRIWGKDSLNPKTVDVHIQWLRQKVEVNPKQPKYLQTIASVGYRLG